MKAFSRSILVSAALLSAVASASAADRAIVVLDASGSMWGQIDGKPKLEIARDALRSVLKTVPAGTEIGLMAYGHRDKASCSDIELVVPPAAGSADAITAAADSLKFQGKTPLTAAVKQAAEDLDYIKQKATVILITDGLESCKGDPCALGKELKQSGAGLTVDVVGFGLTATEGRQVACLAENTGGKYIQASDARGLQAALAQTVAATAVAPAPAPEPASVPAVTPAEPVKTATEATEQVGVGHVVLKVLYAQDGEEVEASGLDVKIYKTATNAGGSREQVSQGAGPDTNFDLPAGDYVAVLRLDQAEVEQPFSVRTGETSDVTAVIDAGILAITAPGATSIKVFSAGRDNQGNRKEFGHAFADKHQTTLPAGDYVIEAETNGGKKEGAASVHAGERSEVTIP
ncbi:VWA domain-containing protein [Mesorhizobium sp. ANAO-SY3R2]|uniref:vWA domain-containing protein n=1 Tax=Mesorhizobium sp. ANAO-SY3R2 TaxID=3166644 RepID=UPI00366D4AD7